jgi:hypothetical protein
VWLSNYSGLKNDDLINASAVEFVVLDDPNCYIDNDRSVGLVANNFLIFLKRKKKKKHVSRGLSEKRGETHTQTGQKFGESERNGRKCEHLVRVSAMSLNAGAAHREDGTGIREEGESFQVRDPFPVSAQGRRLNCLTFSSKKLS